MSHSVLFVDDEPNVLAGLQRAVRSQDWQVFVAESADEAENVLREHQVDVIVCDEQMPGTSGTEFLAAVSEQYPHTIRIVLTGHASLSSAMSAINDGQVFKYIIKPCDDASLVWLIRTALERREQQGAQGSPKPAPSKVGSLLQRAKLFKRLRSPSVEEQNEEAQRDWEETPLFADGDEASGGRATEFDDTDT